MAAVLLGALALASIYPENHWDHTTKLTKANVDSVIDTTLGAGKTLFVRFIASEG